MEIDKIEKVDKEETIGCKQKFEKQYDTRNNSRWKK